MEHHWKASDASNDARMSLSNLPKNHWEILEHKAIVNLGHDYLSLHRLLTGQPAKHKPTFINEPYTVEQQHAILFGDEDSTEGDLNGRETFPRTCEGRENETRTIIDLSKDDVEAMQERETDVRNTIEGTYLAEGDIMVEPNNEKKGNQREHDESAKGKYLAEAQNVDEGNQIMSRKASNRTKYVITEKKTHCRKRKLSEFNEENNVVQLENEMEHLLRSLSEVGRDGKENEFENVFERFSRNFNEIRRIKNRALEMENSMKEKAKQLVLILSGSEDRPTAALIEGSDSRAFVLGGNSVHGNSKLSDDMDATCLVQAEKIIHNVKVEPSDYVPDEDVEVLDYDAFVKQGISSSFVPAKSSLADYTGNNPVVVAKSAAESEFRRELMEILRKPFDKEEYENLSKMFEEGSYRRSVPGVGRKLKIYRYKREKRMNIFRGLFFWLENMTRAGSFTPWDDRQCLAI